MNSIPSVSICTMSFKAQSKYHRGARREHIVQGEKQSQYWVRGRLKKLKLMHPLRNLNEWRGLVAACFNSEECCWITSKVRNNWRTANAMTLCIWDQWSCRKSRLFNWLPADKTWMKEFIIAFCGVCGLQDFVEMHCYISLQCFLLLYDLLLDNDLIQMLSHG